MAQEGAVNIARALFFVAIALTSCKSEPARIVHAGDAGWTYDLTAQPDASALEGLDGGSRPSLVLVAGAPGARGDLDGVADGARVGLVSGMVRVGDALVFADEGNGSIRRFDPITGAVETLAVLPPTKDHRPALPAYAAFDGKRVFVTDRARDVVYALDPATRVLTVAFGTPVTRGDADGDAAHALFDTPTGVAFDGDHALYVADTGSRAIRKIDLATSTVSTVARGLMQPWGLCVSRGELFVNDALQSALLRVDLATGATTNVSGSNRFGYSASKDGKPAVARLGEPRGLACTDDTFYVTDRGGGLVRVIRRSDGVVSSLAGRNNIFGVLDGKRASALLSDPEGVLVWDDKTLYVGDDATLRFVDRQSGVVRTVAGNGVETLAPPYRQNSLNAPSGVAFVPSEGAAYVASCRSSSIERIDVRSGDLTTLVGNQDEGGFTDGAERDARFACAESIAYDGAGNLFVGDHGNHAIRGVHIASRAVLTVAGTPSRCGNDDGPATIATFCDPSGLAAQPGVLYVSDAASHTIRRVDLPTGSVRTIAGRAFDPGKDDGTNARFSRPRGIALDAGALFVADEGNGTIRRIDLGTSAVTTIATGFDEPRAIAAIDGELLVADRTAIKRVSQSGAVAIVPAGHGLRLGSNPNVSLVAAIVPLGNHDALVVDESENVLLRLFY
jgi:DNA-binding beta-propeller fold protein YncE